MSAVVSAIGFVDDAENFAVDKSREFKAMVGRKFKGQEVIITVRRRPSNTTAQQYRYLRGVIIPAIADACGYIGADTDDCEQVYQGLMWRLFRLPDGPFGEPRRESCSRAEMTRERLAQVIDTIVLHAETTIVGCTIPRPEDVDLDKVPDREWEAA